MLVKNLEKKEKSTVSFDVLCDAAEFEKAIDAAYRKNKNRIFVQGFRKGKAPRMVVEGMYGKDIFYEDATDEIAPEAFRFAVEQEGLRTVGTPAVSKVDVSDAKELTLSFVTAVWPEVTLGEYKGLKAPKAKVEITDEKIDAELEKIRRRNARIVTAERPAKDGDTAIIDYRGTVDGVAFDGGTAEGQALILGSGTFIPGFEEQVVGMSAGEERDINVTFPEEYHEKTLSGKAAVFHVKVNEVKEEIMPELDDEFAKDVSEFDTLAEYRNAVRGRMEASEKDSAEADFQSALIEIAGDNITADIPDAMVSEQMDTMIREYDQNLQMNGLNLETYLKYIGQDVNAFRETCRPTAERRVKTDLLLDAVAKAEGIEVSDEDIAAEYDKVAAAYDTELDTVKAAVPESAIVGDIKARRAAEIIFNSGIATEPEAEEKKAPAKKPAAKKTASSTTKKTASTAKKSETAEKKPAAKKTTSSTAKKTETAEKKPAAKKSTSTAKKAETAEKKPAAKKTSAKKSAEDKAE